MKDRASQRKNAVRGEGTYHNYSLGSWQKTGISEKMGWKEKKSSHKEVTEMKNSFLWQAKLTFSGFFM